MSAIHLPTTVHVPARLIDEDGDVEEILLDHLSAVFGYCVNSFLFERKEDMYECFNIDWDTSE